MNPSSTRIRSHTINKHWRFFRVHTVPCQSTRWLGYPRITYESSANTETIPDPSTPCKTTTSKNRPFEPNHSWTRRCDPKELTQAGTDFPKSNQTIRIHSKMIETDWRHSPISPCSGCKPVKFCNLQISSDPS